MLTQISTSKAWLLRPTRCGSLALGALACLGTMQTQLASAQETPVAYAMLGSSQTPHHINSIEIQLAALSEEETSPVVTALASSLNGRFIAAAGDDHGIRIVDITTGNTIRTIEAHQDWIRALQFSVDGQRLFSAGDDGRVLSWKHGYPVHADELVSVPFAIRALALSPGKQLLAIAGFSAEVLIFDLETSEIRHRLLCQHGDQRCVRFSGDGKHLLSGGRDGELHVWDSETGRELAHFHEHRGRVHTATFSRDGNVITSVGEDRRLIQYDLLTQSVRLTRELAHAKLMSMCMVNENLLAVAGADNSVHLYDALTDDVVAHLRGHFGTVSVMTPCGDYLASGSFDTTIRIWDLESIDAEKIDYTKPVHAPLKMDRSLHHYK